MIIVRTDVGREIGIADHQLGPGEIHVYAFAKGLYFRAMKLERLHFSNLSGPAIFDSAARLSTAAFTLVAVLLAGSWLSELTAPRPVAELSSTAMVQSESATGSIGRLFASASVKVEAVAVEGLQLTGVYSGTRGGGFATIHTQAGDVHAFPGDEVAPGVILKHIERDRVILLASGVEKELMLPETAAPAAESPPQTAPTRPRQTFRPDQER